MENIVLALLAFAIAVYSTRCARSTRRTRNYYPMQRVLWAILGFVYGGGALSALVAIVQGGDHQPAPFLVRLAFNLLVLGGTVYSDRFMRRRNAVARFIPVGPLGDPEMVPVETLRHEFERMVSYLGHGAMPAEWVPELDRARAGWQEQEDGRQRLARQIIDRRTRRGID